MKLKAVFDEKEECNCFNCISPGTAKDVNGNCVECYDFDWDTMKCVPCGTGEARNSEGECVERSLDCCPENSKSHALKHA